MIAGIVASAIVALVVLVYVAWPLFRENLGTEVAAGLGEVRELHSRRDMLLASLKDLDDDRATGKIDETDFEQLHARLSADAIKVMRQLDELDARRRAEAKDPPLRHPAAPPPGRVS